MVWPVALIPGTLPYAVVVLIMLAVEIGLLLLLIPRGRERPTVALGILVASALVGSAGALIGVFWAVLFPNLNSLTIVFEALGISMGFPPGLWMISLIAFHDRRLDPGSAYWPTLIAGVATLGEVLMGLIFVAAAGPLGTPLAIVAATLVSPWYLWSSAAAMLSVLLWIPLDRDRRRVLGSVALAGVVAPWVPADPVVGASLMMGVMGLTFGLVLAAYRPRSARSPGLGPVVRAIAVAFVAMTASGIAVAATDGSVLSLAAFGATMSGVMSGELRYLLVQGLGVGAPTPRGVELPSETAISVPAP